MNPPDHLVIYLSRRCDLACPYCYAAPSVPGTLRKRDLFRALAEFCALPGREKKFTFLGGEPLLHKPLLLAALKRIRALAPGAPVTVFTNGTRLDAAALRRLKAAGARVAVSLGGAAARLPRAAAAGLTASLVVTPSTAASLPEELARARGRGYRSIAWAPDITAQWPPAALAALKKSLARVKKDYLSSLGGEGAYEIANAYEYLDRSLGRGFAECSSLTLGPDGSYYPCDKVLGAPRRELARLGWRGPGGARRAEFFRRAAAAGARPSRLMCAVGPWAYSRFAAGRRGGALARTLASQAALRVLLSGFYRGLIKAAQASPAFRRLHGLEARR